MSQTALGHGTPVLVLIVAGAYLLGSVPFGLLLARGLAGVDVRAGGSGNIGATNVARLAGRGLGLLTLILDAAKGSLPVLVMSLWAGPWWVAVAGATAFLGHCFPIWMLFRGGKGVATALGVLLVTAPFSAAAGAAVYALLLLVFRISSLGSLLAVLAAIPVAFLTAGPIFGALAGFMGATVILKHHQNIRRLFSGAEPGV